MESNSNARVLASLKNAGGSLLLGLFFFLGLGVGRVGDFPTLITSGSSSSFRMRVDAPS